MRLEKERASVTNFLIPKRLSWIKNRNHKIYPFEVILHTHVDQFHCAAGKVVAHGISFRGDGNYGFFGSHRSEEEEEEQIAKKKKRSRRRDREEEEIAKKKSIDAEEEEVDRRDLNWRRRRRLRSTRPTSAD